MSTEIRNIFTVNQTLAIRDANAPSAANVFATMADVGGGGSSIYTANDTIGSGRVATVTDTLNFQSVSGAVYGGWIIKPALVGAGANEYATISYGADTIISKYRANQAYAFGKLSDTTNNFDFNTGANPNYSSVDTVFISGGATHTNTLHVKGGGSTTATSSFKLEDSAGNRQLQMFDSGLLALETQSSTGSNLSFYSAGGGSLIATFQKTSSTGLLLNMRSSGTTFFYTRDLYTSFPFWGGSWRGVKIGGANAAPDLSACLELDSTTKGFLPSRMTTVQMDAIGSPAAGLIIYDETTNQWMGYNGTSWVIMG